MNEGWVQDQYVILFDEQEQISFTKYYALAEFLPSYQIAGLLGWDDLIVLDAKDSWFIVPTVPLIKDYLKSFSGTIDFALRLEPDSRYKGLIKWYIKPIIFGGSPTDEHNIVWITPFEHAELVTWWNRLYRQMNEANTATGQ